MPIPAPIKRFLYPTPGWLVILSLAVTGILFLSERFQWFPFNTHKGWTVLIAVAAVGLVLVLMFFWFVIALLSPLRLQFSIRSLLVVTVAVALPFSWLATSERFHWFPFANRQGWSVLIILMAAGVAILLVLLWVIAVQWRGWLLPFRWGLLLALILATTMPCIWLGKAITQARRQADSVVALGRLGMVAGHGWGLLGKRPSEPSWLRVILRDDFFDEVGYAGVREDTRPGFGDYVATTDAVFEHLKGFTHLWVLDLHGSEVTDAGLECIKDFRELEWVDLSGTKITDERFKTVQHVSSQNRVPCPWPNRIQIAH